ncbi:trans-aconitate 2-methyltransferase [Comamonadaceae bacterium OS-1]|nr:trans-aconitate 2-methyltransferase [Comamonadaceae bacterium OS-1]
MQTDPWLTRWLPHIAEHAEGLPVLEIGCGSGADTATLVGAGIEVVAFDLDASAIERARQQVPGATFLVRDVREPFPPEVRETGAIVASLSLHYFPWDDTLALFQKVRQTLKPGGLLVCRLNSTQDIHFGATGYPEIEPNYYMVDGAPKRFFDQASVNAILATGWQILSVQHLFTDKYVKPKALWEFVCTKSDF